MNHAIMWHSRDNPNVRGCDDSGIKVSQDWWSSF